MNLLPANERVLRARFPDALDQVLKADVADASYIFNDRGEGIYYREGNERVYPYGTRSSVELVNRWLKGVTGIEGGFYGLSGFGDGGHVRAVLRESLGQAGCLCVFEPSAAWLRVLLSRVDCSDFLVDGRFQLVLGKVSEESFSGLLNMDLEGVKEVGALVFSPLYNREPSYYNQALGLFAKQFGVFHRLKKTSVEDTSLWQQATLRNMGDLGRAPDISAMRGIFEGLPVVLVSAGPSLDVSFEFLKWVKRYAVIVCVNSAYRALMNKGIRPDVSLAADPRFTTYEGYKGQSTEGVYLCAPYFVNEKVVKAFNGRTFVWSNGNSLVEYLKEGEGIGDIKIAELGTISASIGDLAELWGVKQVCLVGQDFSIRSDGQTHVKDSFYGDYGYDNLSKTHKYSLDGNNVETVFAEEKLYTYWNVFNEMVAEHSGVEFVNTSVYGAKIKGAQYMDFAQATKWIGGNEIGGIRERLDSSMVLGSGRQIEAKMESLIVFSERLLSMALELALGMDLLFKDSDGGGIKLAVQKINQMNNFLEKHPREKQVLFEGKTKRLIHEYMEYCVQEVGSSVLQKNKGYCWAMAEGAYFLLSELNEALALKCK